VLVTESGDRGHRWSPGGRLHQIFEETCDRLARTGSDRLAVDTEELQLTYAELDVRANQLAHLLRRRGVEAGTRVALLCDHPVATYTAVLGVLKADAAYVPLDAAFPADRINYIVSDAGADLVVTTAAVRHLVDGTEAAVLCLDDVTAELAAEDRGRPIAAAPRDDELCYVIYTSGTTGRPKGVLIDHSSICHFVRVAAECYGVCGDDRVYQGLTIAFDFSVEEMWVAWAVGATLVPRPPGGSLLGSDLHDFLTRQRVTALCCVPTLLTTIERDLPGVRFLLVSGEACPADLVRQWHRPYRRFLNVYGPTETTVTATWSIVHPERPVTLGRPLPGYSVVVLEPDTGKAVPAGQLGEIAIAGVGLARGYAGRPDLTERAFVPDRLGLPDNPSGRLYRTGDLGCIVDGEVEYHGRIDTQVKVRGYRIELAEIESVLLQLPEVAQAVVSTHAPAPGAVELVAYYARRRGSPPLDPAVAYAHLQSNLPAYSVPAYLEELPAVPMTPSDKADRDALPPPRGARRAAQTRPYVAPATHVEQGLAEEVGVVLGLDEVSVTSHLFEDLGADSLLLAHVCARVRERADLPPISVKDVYQNPTVRSLATALVAPGAAAASAGSPGSPPEVSPRPGRHILCGSLQAAVFLAWSYLVAMLVVFAHEWITTARGALETYERSIAVAGASFLGSCLLPIVAKWLLIGRWREERFPVWSYRYLRLWVVKILIRSSPLALFHGSPLTALYLRALGARVGPGVLVLTNHLPVCSDLLTIGPGAVVRKEAFLNGYRVVGGIVETGPVHIGRDAVVGEQTAMDVRTCIGDRAELAHASSLHAGQSVPDGQRWLGSPAEPGATPPSPVPASSCTGRRRLVYAGMQLFGVIFIWLPLMIAVAGFLLPEFEEIGRQALSDPAFYAQHALLASVLYFGAIGVGLVALLTLARLTHRMLPADRVFPLYGWHWGVQRTAVRFTNLRFYTALFGDSSAIVYWLRGLGWDLSKIEQTGSNFGMAVLHEMPGLCAVGTGTMASDGLSMMNAEFSGTSFRVRRTTIGADNFLGNDLVYPPGGRTADNCLLATKVHVPVDGPVRSDIGLLGSPPFEIPRSVERDHVDDRFTDPVARRAAVRAKNRHNAVTAALFLLVRWVHLVISTLIVVVTIDQHGRWGPSIVALGIVGVLLFTTGYYLLVERCALLRPPPSCSIYDQAFWRHERYWKVPATAYVMAFNGTPFKSLVYRAMGVRLGRRVFDDGSWLTERPLVAIGDDTTLNEGALLQSHSLEDGVFKSGLVRLGNGVTVGPAAFVHYGTTVGNGSLLEPDSFLMKGESVGPRERWGGNPARLLAGAMRLPPAPRPDTVVPGRTVRPFTDLLAQLRSTSPPALPASSGVTVELFDLNASRRVLPALTEFLSDDERRAAEGIGASARQEAFVAGRALLRLLLSARDPSRPPGSWSIHRTATDRPVVRDPGAPDVNLASSGGVLAVALSDEFDIGVDVELLGGRTDSVILWSALTRGERRRLLAAPAPARPELFLRMWTLKEAVLKCTGAGLAGGPERLETTLDPAGVAGEAVAGMAGAPLVHQETWGPPGGSYCLTVVASRRRGTQQVASIDSSVADSGGLTASP
jgi:non-ribosomal peptide synthetase-like protein